MSDMVAQAKGIIKYQTELGNNLSSLRSKEMNARIAFERGKEELAKITRDKTIELSNLPHINTPDPKTGRPNQEWAKMLLDKELEEDEEFRKALVRFWNLQQSFYEAQSEMLDVGEKLSITKSQARLLAALLNLQAEDDDGLVATLAGTD